MYIKNKRLNEINKFCDIQIYRYCLDSAPSWGDDKIIDVYHKEQNIPFPFCIKYCEVNTPYGLKICHKGDYIVKTKNENLYVFKSYEYFDDINSIKRDKEILLKSLHPMLHCYIK